VCSGSLLPVRNTIYGECWYVCMLVMCSDEKYNVLTRLVTLVSVAVRILVIFVRRNFGVQLAVVSRVVYTISVASTVAEGILSARTERGVTVRGREGVGKSVKGARKGRVRGTGC